MEQHTRGTHASNSDTPTTSRHPPLSRGHTRSRSRDASLDNPHPRSFGGLSGSVNTTNHHHTTSCGGGGCSSIIGRRVSGMIDDLTSNITTVSLHTSTTTASATTTSTNNVYTSSCNDTSTSTTTTCASRGSSPGRTAISTTPAGSNNTPPSLLRHAHNIKKSGDTRSGSSTWSSSRRRSPLATRKSTSSTEVTTPGAASGSQNTPQQSRAAKLPEQHQEESYAASSTEDCETDAVLSSGVSNGSGELVESLSHRIGSDLLQLDDIDGSLGPNEQQRAKDALEHIQIKIQKTKDMMKKEQKARDENVNEYLKLAANADRQQLARIKAVFEKKNQKSSVCILQQQKKIESYQKRQRDIEIHGIASSHHRQPKEMLRDMGLGLKRSALINKPKEIAHRIKNKFGSADNIKELAGEEDRDEERVHHGSATLPPGASLIPPTTSTPLTSIHQTTTTTVVQASSGGNAGSVGVGGGGSSGGGAKVESEDGSECNSSMTSESIPGASSTHIGQLSSPRLHQVGGSDLNYWDNHMLMELQDRREENARFREEIETIKQTLTTEVSALRDCLTEERFKYDRLEEQVNDLTELHQNEMENLKTTMTDMEEKVQYQSEERIRDLHEVVENCQTRISRMEHQQAQQQQQFLTLEGLDNSNARALIVKLINILLTVLQVLLLVVATVANILTPLLQTRGRLITTITFFFLLIFIYIQLPEIKETWQMFLERYRKVVSSS